MGHPHLSHCGSGCQPRHPASPPCVQRAVWPVGEVIHSHHVQKCMATIAHQRRRDATKDCHPSTHLYVGWLCPQVLCGRAPVPGATALDPKPVPLISRWLKSKSPASPPAHYWPCVPPLFPHGTRSHPLISTLSKPLTRNTHNSIGCNGSWCWNVEEVPSF